MGSNICGIPNEDISCQAATGVDFVRDLSENALKICLSMGSKIEINHEVH